jgi:hypothetical protein
MQTSTQVVEHSSVGCASDFEYSTEYLGSSPDVVINWVNHFKTLAYQSIFNTLSVKIILWITSLSAINYNAKSNWLSDTDVK